PEESLVCGLEPSRTLRADRHGTEQLIAGVNRNGECAERRDRFGPASWQQRPKIGHEQRRSGAKHSVIGTQAQPLQPGPHALHARWTDERFVHESARSLVPEIDRTASHAKRT